MRSTMKPMLADDVLQHTDNSTLLRLESAPHGARRVLITCYSEWAAPSTTLA